MKIGFRLAAVFLFFALWLFEASALAQDHVVSTGNDADSELTVEERAWLSEHHTVRVRVSEWPPYMFDRPAPSGMSVDYLEKIARRYGFKVQYVSDNIGWPASMADVSGPCQHYDLLLTMNRTPERERKFALTHDYLSMPWVIYARKDTRYITGLDSLKGKTVAEEKGYVIADKIRATHPSIRVLETANSEEALRAVATGKADAYVGNLVNANFQIREHGFGNLEIVATTPFGDHTQAMAVRRDWPALASLINKGLSAMTPDERHTIAEKWVAVQIKPHIDYTRAWWVSASAAVVLLVFIYWNRLLKQEVGKRKNAESKLREEKETAQRYLDTVQTIMVALDRDGHITMINRAGCELLGFEEGELLGHNWFSTCIPQPKGMDLIYPAFRRFVNGELEWSEHFENIIRRMDGSERLCAWHTTHFRDHHGRIVGTLSSGEDITERRQAEDALHESQRLLQSVIENIPLRVFWKDRESRYLGCNSQFATDAGLFIPEEVIGQSDFDLAWKDQADLYRADDLAVMNPGAPKLDYEEPQTTPDGKTIWLHTSKVPLRQLSDGEVFGVLGIYEDVTERKEAVERLRQSEEKLRSLYELSPIGIALTDMQGRYLDFNNAFVKITGYPAEELKTLDYWVLTPAEYAEQEAAQLESLRKTGRYGPYEKEYRQKNGRLIPIRLNGVLVSGNDGQPCIWSLVEDIGEQRQSQEVARERLEEVSQLQRLQTANELATMLAHELNQPLTAITMYVAAAQKHLKKAAVTQDCMLLGESLESVEQQALRAGEIIKHLRAFVGRSRVKPVPFDLNKALQNASALIVPNTRGRHIRLDLQLDPALPPVMGVEVYVEQVLINLLRNAYEAIGGAGMENGEISVKSVLAGNMAQVSVCDNGPGIAPEKANSLFERMESSKQDGLGVGLRISRSLIEAQEGRLWVEQCDPGCAFHFSLPLAE